MKQVRRRQILTGAAAAMPLLMASPALAGLGQILRGKAQRETQQLTAATLYNDYFSSLTLDELEQVRLGELIYRNAITRMGGAYRNSVAQDALEQFANPFFQASLNRLFRWEITLIDNDTVNAWALPGGKIGLHKGVLRYVDTADELGWVVAHEMGHAEAGHPMEILRGEAFFTKLPSTLRQDIAANLNQRGSAGLLEPAIAKRLELPLLAMISAGYEADIEIDADQQTIPAFRQTGLDVTQAAAFQEVLQSLYAGKSGSSCLYAGSSLASRRAADLQQMAPSISSLASRKQTKGFDVLKSIFPTRQHFRRTAG